MLVYQRVLLAHLVAFFWTTDTPLWCSDPLEQTGASSPGHKPLVVPGWSTMLLPCGSHHKIEWSVAEMVPSTQNQWLKWYPTIKTINLQFTVYTINRWLEHHNVYIWLFSPVECPSCYITEHFREVESSGCKYSIYMYLPEICIVI